MNKDVNSLNVNTNSLPDDVTELRKVVAKKEAELLKKDQQIEQLLDAIILLRQKRFGRSTDQVNKDQINLFDEAELETLLEELEEQVKPPEEDPTEALTSQPPAKKKKPVRRPLPANLKRVEKIIDLSDEEKQQTLTEFESYLALASTYSKSSRPQLVIMRGLSASGKSTVSQQLVDKTGMIRIRSDIERKRLFNISSTIKMPDEIDTGIYSAEASQQTYKKLAELVSKIISAGYSVIVDAAFLKHQQREPFQQLAAHLNLPYVIIEITAPADVLRQRITKRKNDVSDADLSVLENQLANYQPLQESEISSAIPVDTSETIDINDLINRIKTR